MRREFRRWWREHADLNQLVDTLVGMIAGGRVGGAEAVFEDLAETMETHLRVEEETYFPVVEKYSPRHSDILQEARLAHRELRVDLQAIREQLSRGQLGAATTALGALLDHLRAHQQMEAGLIADLGNTA